MLFRSVELTSELFKPFMNKFFKCGKHSSFIFIMSLISGIPSNAKYIKALYDEGYVSPVIQITQTVTHNTGLLS